MKKRGFKATLGVVVASGMLFVGLAQPASAQSDEQIIIDNIPAAVEVLQQELTEAAQIAASEGFEAGQRAVGQALVATATALVDGTDRAGQFRPLPAGVSTFLLGVNGALNPFVAALDDPSLVAELYSEDDVNLLLSNLIPAVEHVVEKVAEVPGEALAGDLKAVLYSLLGSGVFQESGAVPGGLAILLNGQTHRSFATAVSYGLLLGLPAVDQAAGNPYLYEPFEQLITSLRGALG